VGVTYSTYIEVVINNFLNKVDFLGKFDINHSQSDDRIEAFGILPSIKNPRWIIPLKNRNLIIASLALYQPSLLKAKLIKKMTVLTAKSGLSEVIAKDKIYLQKKDNFIRELFKKDNLHYAIFTGTEGCHRKVTVQVMDEEGNILGYIKVSDNQEIDRILENETEILGDLLRLEIRNGLFPKVIYHGHINDVNILVLDTMKSTKSTFRSKLSDSHVNFLSEIFQKTAQGSKYKESGFAKGFRKRLRDLEIERLGDGETDRLRKLERIIDFIENQIGNERLPFGLCHRDFTPWNTFFHDGKLYVFDWEYAEREYPPLLDVFHFIVQDGILVRHLNPQGLLKRVLKHEKMLSKYSSLVGVKNDSWMPLLACYLIDISLLYIEREKGRIEGEIKQKIDIWAGIIELILSNSS
jgi:hypothetical protein